MWRLYLHPYLHPDSLWLPEKVHNDVGVSVVNKKENHGGAKGMHTFIFVSADIYMRKSI